MNPGQLIYQIGLHPPHRYPGGGSRPRFCCLRTRTIIWAAASTLAADPARVSTLVKRPLAAAVPRPRLLPYHGHVLVATLLRRGATTTAKVYCYGSSDPVVLGGAAGLARRLAEQHQARTALVVWFLPPGGRPDSQAVATRVQLRAFEARPPAEVTDTSEPVTCYHDLPAAVAATFAQFAGVMAADGFAFLYQRMRCADPGPVLTVVDDGQVIGAIGPIQFLADPAGQARLLPQYCGVLPTHRGRGLGRVLWRAAMAWGATHGAAYQILSTVVDGASDRLCRSEGLTELGSCAPRRPEYQATGRPCRGGCCVVCRSDTASAGRRTPPSRFRGGSSRTSSVDGGLSNGMVSGRVRGWEPS